MDSIPYFPLSINVNRDAPLHSWWKVQHQNLHPSAVPALEWSLDLLAAVYFLINVQLRISFNLVKHCLLWLQLISIIRLLHLPIWILFYRWAQPGQNRNLFSSLSLKKIRMNVSFKWSFKNRIVPVFRKWTFNWQLFKTNWNIEISYQKKSSSKFEDMGIQLFYQVLGRKRTGFKNSFSG